MDIGWAILLASVLLCATFLSAILLSKRLDKQVEKEARPDLSELYETRREDMKAELARLMSLLEDTKNLSKQLTDVRLELLSMDAHVFEPVTQEYEMLIMAFKSQMKILGSALAEQRGYMRRKGYLCEDMIGVSQEDLLPNPFMEDE